MQQHISVITLGVEELARSKRFHGLGFGWTPVFENDEIVFYQMNGLVLGTFLVGSLEADMQRSPLCRPGAVALAHNVARRSDVAPLIDRLERAGGTVLRRADAPPHGGYRGYVADPDDHAWEVAWNPAWSLDADGNVTFSI
jgi:predicted lactoylglutathione lyase